MKHPLPWLSLFSSLLVAGPAGGAAEWLLCDFETPEEIAAWQAHGSGTAPKLERIDGGERVTSGRFAGAFSVASCRREGNDRYPAITLAGKTMTRNDWRNYDELRFDVENPGKNAVTMWVSLKMEDGLSHAVTVDLAPGRHRRTVALPEVVRRGRLAELRLSYSEPPEDCTIYLDRLALATNPERLAKRQAQLKQQIDRPERRAVREAAAATGQFQQLSARVAALAIAPEAPEAAAEQLTELEHEFLALEKQCDERFNARQAAAFSARFRDAGWGYARESGSCKVFRDTVPFQGEFGGAISLRLARHEAEAAQLVLRADRPVDNVRVAVGELVSADGRHRLPPTAVSAVLVGYVTPRPVTYIRKAAEHYPDVLLTGQQSFRLDAGVWQPVWIEVRAPRDAAPGRYRGTITVTGDGMKPMAIPLEAKIWNFTLPVASSLPNLFTYEANNNHRHYARTPEDYKEFERFRNGEIPFEALNAEGRRLRQLEIDSENLLLDHRCSPSSLYKGRRTTPIADIKRWVERGASCYNIIYVKSIPSLKPGEPYPAERRADLLRIIDDAVPKLREAGILKQAVIYSFDEINPNQFAAARDILGEIKRRHPDIPILTTAYDDTFGDRSGLRGIVDIWTPLTPRYAQYRKEIEKERALGHRIWYYTCLAPTPPWANLLLEQPAVAPRLLLGAMAMASGTDGYLYYQTTMWCDDIKLITGGPLTGNDGASWYQGFNGDGLLLYAGVNGPLPSLRLKAIRDGLEDYEYLVLLKQLDDGDTAGRRPLSEADRREVRALRQELETVGGDFRKYDTDGRALLAFRDRLGALLDRLAR